MLICFSAILSSHTISLHMKKWYGIYVKVVKCSALDQTEQVKENKQRTY